MTYEEMEHTMQFILDQQAQISANARQHGENFLAIEARLQKLQEVVAKLGDPTS